MPLRDALQTRGAVTALHTFATPCSFLFNIWPFACQRIGVANQRRLTFGIFGTLSFTDTAWTISGTRIGPKAGVWFTAPMGRAFEARHTFVIGTATAFRKITGTLFKTKVDREHVRVKGSAHGNYNLLQWVASVTKNS